MSIIIEPDFIPGVNHNNKSCTWYFTINKEHFLEIYRDRNYTLGKPYTDSSFLEENEKILNSVRGMDIFLKKLDTKFFILKTISNKRPEEILSKRKNEFELNEDNIGKYTFITL